MHVGIALAVRVAHHVYGDTIDEDGEVGSVIRIEAPEKDLIAFAAAVMLADD
jgi:hypothetical protein